MPSTAAPFVRFEEDEALEHGVSDHTTLDDVLDDASEESTIASHPIMYPEQVRERIRT